MDLLYMLCHIQVGEKKLLTNSTGVGSSPVILTPLEEKLRLFDAEEKTVGEFVSKYFVISNNQSSSLYCYTWQYKNICIEGRGLIISMP